MQNQETFISQIREFFRRRLSQRKIITSLVMLAVIIPTIGLGRTILKSAPKQIYQVAVMVLSQHNPDPAEDLRTSLKKGDVLAVHDENHNFSRSESISYLILKIKLNEDHATKLTQPDEKELTKKEIEVEIERMRAELEERAAESGREVTEEQLAREEERIRNQRITIRPRLYFIDLSKGDFAEFKANDLLEGQPFQDKVYNWGIVDKKKAVE